MSRPVDEELFLAFLVLVALMALLVVADNL